MAKISTGTGDDGTTGLVGGARVAKSAQRVEVIGAVDETNDALGLAAALATRGELKALLRTLQEDLFALGADVMAPEGTRTIRITPTHVTRLVREEDRLEAALPPLQHFILPGGTPCAAALQLARSMARRAEREAWRAHAAAPLGGDVMVYLNRLSDLLFLLAREENVKAGVEDQQWMGRHAP
ncbi:MAG: cob(I)yrinic acid a,c-diamide adenosyltransferase [Candidatus Thermoplasmatota archaeon]